MLDLWVTGTDDTPVIARIHNTSSDRDTIELLRRKFEQHKCDGATENQRPTRFRTPSPLHRRHVQYNDDGLCWFHASFGADARRGRPTCTWTEGPTSTDRDAASRKLYALDLQGRRRLMIGTSDDLIVVPPTHQDRRFPSPNFSLQLPTGQNQHIRPPQSHPRYRSWTCLPMGFH